jgi:uncharacterized membrane protein
MAFCPNCGTQVAGRFCPNCGTDMSAAAGAAPGGGNVPPNIPPQGPAMSFQAAGMQENVASALCYLAGFISGIIFLVLAPYNRNRTIRFHAFQSIFGSIAVFVINIVFVIGIFGMFHMWFIGHTLWLIFRLLVFVLWIYLMYSAYNNRKIKLPVIGDLAEKQA